MTRSLKELEATFHSIVTVTTTEIETEIESCKGQFVFRGEDGEKFMWGPRPYRYDFHDVATAAEAHGLMFLCPACFDKNNGSVGTHSVHVSFANRDFPEEAGSRDSTGKPSRWTVVSGNTFEDLVLVPSILLGAGQAPEVGCHWHGYVGSNGIPAGHAG